jgi:hypothetical protein
MSTLTQTEQTTPSTPAANQQRLYPKVGGLYRMNSAGTEILLLDQSNIDNTAALLFIAQQYGGL